MGRWYELRRDERIPFYDGDCTTADYTLKSDGTVDVKNTDSDNVDDADEGSGTAYPNRDWPGVLAVKFSPFQPTQSNYKIIGTDYTTYSIVYSCSAYVGGLYNIEYAWVLTRDPLTDQSDIDSITTTTDAIFADKVPTYDTSLLQYTAQGGDCTYIS
mmetsp:Transcript_72761/g.100889  ORF Transcript_72761/g.100889 Transcript_72761/m.100889 type:complete len:157 (+) Transcript_72761:152-622(+)|eukprot:CAMPEP_0176378614 /NCGR_PEP_ID=MMETSP0126-20121128/29753_1 /TAXON_ID=141414 ORGANISM="Strombidinopsis acuminatum, Strain SPMC142" /NCGR_SAMPLE_ID=MMETSP0126 /ASSEMBLY_ACC=CAM_ASM_000229 /LENGTH=156 /DNA_ID=CAMNT_0017741005 /DNA_START=151 /DNA_END=621 /DNA_ORIENTATION=+